MVTVALATGAGFRVGLAPCVALRTSLRADGDVVQLLVSSAGGEELRILCVTPLSAGVLVSRNPGVLGRSAGSEVVVGEVAHDKSGPVRARLLVDLVLSDGSLDSRVVQW